MVAEHILTEEDLSTRRLARCVENWPEAESGDYNPYCCRFPKSCSPHGYIEAVEAGNLREEHLEPRREPVQPPEEKPWHPGVGWHLKADNEPFDAKHVLIEWSADAQTRKVWIED